ncbi:cookie monster [Cochliomyia hominivorax]
MDPNIPYIIRQDIVNFPFPYKLWLVVHLDYCEFLRWNRDGTVILLDLVALEDYLNSTRSIFKIKNNSSFLQHLQEFQFERLNAKPEAEEDLLLQYKHEHFQRHRLDLLAKIRRHTYQVLGEQTNSNTEDYSGATTKISKHVSERMLGDLCFMFHGGLSKIKRSRLRFQTILQFHNEKRILKQKLKASESVQSSKNKTVIGNTLGSEDDQVIELPVDLFENPHDSVLYLSDDFRPEYAGYYGNCGKDQIVQFFGEYLPMYEDGSMEVKKVGADNCGSSDNNSLITNTETSIMQNSSTPIAITKPNILISTPNTINPIYNLNFSSNLEPIYVTNAENLENIDPNTNNNNNIFSVTHLNSNNFENETDISMDEFIKFKNAKTENHIESYNTNVENCNSSLTQQQQQSEEKEDIKPFPQMPTSVQMEITGDVKENEASFRNFFSQYRASLNLLYEKQ